MIAGFFEGLRQFFKGYSVQTRKECRYCGGGRCMGMCGGGLAKARQVKVQGRVHLDEAKGEAYIENQGEIVMTFDPKMYFGRLILKKCPPGECCQVEALVQDLKMDRLISVKKLGEVNV